MATDVTYVQFAPGDFLSDADFQAWPPALRGVYCTIIFFLYRNGGKIRDDSEYIRVLCNWQGEGWNEAYQTVRAKFRVRKPNLYHKRVGHELKKAREFRQAKRRAGLAGAEARWHSHSTANGTAMAKGSKGKVSKKRQKQTQPKSGLRWFTDEFGQRWETAHGKAYAWSKAEGVKAAKIWQQLGHDQGEATKMLTRYFADASPFFTGHPIGKLLSSFAQFYADSPSGPPSGETVYERLQRQKREANEPA